MSFTKTVYSVCYPEVKRAFEVFLDNKDISNLFLETWTKKQDSIHTAFFDKYIEWVKPRVNINFENFKFRYPTGGSSEAIREQIVYLHSLGKRLIVFSGEYEGYEAIAKAIGMEVLKINRGRIEDILTAANKLDSDKDVFILSQPSSMDGFFWEDYEIFLNKLENLKINFYVDLAYIGNFNYKKKINLDNYNYLRGIFFSLSKVFGVYYHRIGGVFLKDENPLLFGNQWFKNIFSIKFGEYLLEKFPIGYFDDKLKSAQKEAVRKASVEYGINIIPSDVFLLGVVVKNEDQYPWQTELIRDQSSALIRVCFSPLLEKELYAKN